MLGPTGGDAAIRHYTYATVRKSDDFAGAFTLIEVCGGRGQFREWECLIHERAVFPLRGERNNLIEVIGGSFWCDEENVEA